MAKRNILIQEQVLAMILASTGALPFCLTKDSPAAMAAAGRRAGTVIGDIEDPQEKQLMQLVMQYVLHSVFLTYDKCLQHIIKVRV